MSDGEWLLLNFTLPKEPSMVRVSVWRKLKKCGAICIGQSMWLLPFSDQNQTAFTEIANEITSNHGTAFVLSANFLAAENSDDIVAEFNTLRNEEYKEFLGKCEDYFQEIAKETGKGNFTFAELEENEEEFNKLQMWMDKIIARDFFKASLRQEAEEKLSTCQRLLDEFSRKVFELNLP